jgi:redox-sensitive bicupin YhaK (pirin superfamily)
MPQERLLDRKGSNHDHISQDWTRYHGPAGWAGIRRSGAFAPVIPPGNFESTNPFFLMMDDRISVAGQFGGEHPHAGLETVTFMLSGSMEDLGGKLLEGDVEWMTAGRGIIHRACVRLGRPAPLAVVVVLPESQRRVAPRVQLLSRDLMPLRREPGVEARVYSGRSGSVESTTTNAVPVTLVEIRLEAGATFDQELPSSYNAFLFVLNGAVTAGDPPASIAAGQGTGRIRPLQLGPAPSPSSPARPSRLLLYAGERRTWSSRRGALSSPGPSVSWPSFSANSAAGIRTCQRNTPKPTLTPTRLLPMARRWVSSTHPLD